MEGPPIWQDVQPAVCSTGRMFNVYVHASALDVQQGVHASVLDVEPACPYKDMQSAFLQSAFHWRGVTSVVGSNVVRGHLVRGGIWRGVKSAAGKIGGQVKCGAG